LTIGNPAPKLEVKEFVKASRSRNWPGERSTSSSSGDLVRPVHRRHAARHRAAEEAKDVIFIGVSIWERDPAGVKPFVEKRARDGLPGGRGRRGRRGRREHRQDGQELDGCAAAPAFPSTFIVNAEGRSRGIGHPMSMDKPLDDIVAGKWDIAKARGPTTRRSSWAAKIAGHERPRSRSSRSKKDMKGLLALVDEAIKDEPGVETALATVKLEALGKVGDAEKAIEYGNRLVENCTRTARRLNNVLR